MFVCIVHINLMASVCWQIRTCERMHCKQGASDLNATTLSDEIEEEKNKN